MSRHATPGWSQAGTSGAARLPEPRAEDFDALADLFLGPGEAPSPGASAVSSGTGREPEPAGSPEVELLVLGHLPVRAPLWARQYAWELAQRSPAPVALVRLVAGTLQVEVLAPGLEPEAPMTDAAGALREAFSQAGRVLVRVDEPDEPRLARWSGASSITLLSGVDDAAVVAAYRAIKSLGPGEEGDGPGIRVAWMGCSPEASNAAMVKLERACEAFLQRPLASGGCAARIDGAQGRVLFRGPIPPGSTLEDLLGAAARESAACRARRHAARPEPGASRAGVLRLATQHDDRPDDDAWAEAGTTASGHAASTGTPASASPGAADRTPQGSGEPRPPSFASLLAGLTALPATCPDTPGVELAMDQRGGLHLLVLDDRGGASALVACRAWAGRHAPLLARACEGLSEASCAEAALHLVTRDAPSAAPLLHTPMHLHLAVPVPGGWVLAPLNRPG